MITAGYSGTPLAKKLGIKENFTIKLINAPDHYFSLFTDFPPNVKVMMIMKPQKTVFIILPPNKSL